MCVSKYKIYTYYFTEILYLSLYETLHIIQVDLLVHIIYVLGRSSNWCYSITGYPFVGFVFFKKMAGLILLYFVRLHEPRVYYIYTNTLLFGYKSFSTK